ncbi:hypothetical protein EVAR_37598_1 [Eumeta japonica]|uniref:Uncharacterized protein n=1 Tax=Eumeta variegata TaxID=151549 RepID=A0A4C1VPA7_EUMVA|nr:hypothetical protein EVAR_37598_1 [Eumeta japonica]
MLWLYHENGRARVVRHYAPCDSAPTKCSREVAASAVSFRPVSESFGSSLPPPRDILFLPKRPTTHRARTRHLMTRGDASNARPPPPPASDQSTNHGHRLDV